MTIDDYTFLLDVPMLECSPVVLKDNKTLRPFVDRNELLRLANTHDVLTNQSFKDSVKQSEHIYLGALETEDDEPFLFVLDCRETWTAYYTVPDTVVLSVEDDEMLTGHLTNTFNEKV